MIRWSYLGPRLAVVGIALAALWFALNPLLRWTLIHEGRSLTGAEVEIDSLETSLLSARMELQGVAAADPNHTDRNMVEADRMCLDFDAAALLRKEFHISEASISGIRFNTDRETSGKLAATNAMGLGGLGVDWSDLASRLAELLADSAKERFEEELDDLESIQMAEEIQDRWPKEYDSLLERSEALKTRIEEIRERFRKPSDPLTMAKLVQRTSEDVESIREEMASIVERAKELRGEAEKDTHALAEAGKRDVERLRGRYVLDDFQAADLSRYLLRQETEQRLEELVAWVRWARRWAPKPPAELDEYEAERGQGVNILFGSADARPDFWVRRVHLDGAATIEGREFAFVGQVDDLTNEPSLLGAPTVARFLMRPTLEEGAEDAVAMNAPESTVEIECSVDYTEGEPRQRIVINCPALQLPEKTLGDEKRLSVAITPGSIHLWMEAEIFQGEIKARVLAKQTGVRLTPHFGGLDEQSPFLDRMASTFESVDTIETAVHVRGKLDSPEWHLQSNLGPALADGVRSAIDEELVARRKEVETIVQGRLRRELDLFDQLVRNRLSQLEKTHGLLNDEADGIARNLVSGAATQGTLRQTLSERVPGMLMRGLR